MKKFHLLFLKFPFKNFLLAGLTAISILALLAGCGGQAPAPQMFTATAPAAQDASNPGLEAATEAAPAQAAEAVLDSADARQAVIDFLTAVQLDANSSIASQLLTPILQQEAVQSEGLQAALLKTSETIPSFEVSAPQLNQDGQGAVVEATLYLQKPVNFSFTLIPMDGMWKINEVKSLASGGDYPATPEGVVQAFLIAYQERPDDMPDYLTAPRRANQPPGGAVGMLQVLGALEGVLVKSAIVNPEPPMAVILLMIKAGGIESQRQFILLRENERWGIDQIMTIQ